MNEKYLLTQINKITGRLETLDIRTGEVVATNGRAVAQPLHIYTRQSAEAISHLVAEGSSLTAIGQMEGMPSLAILYRWMDVYPDFKGAVRAARKLRAENFRHKAEVILENTHDKDEVSVNKFKFEGYMKLAEKDDPETYGSSAANQTGSGLALQLIVSTGIVRESDQEVVDVEFTRRDGFGGDGAAGGLRAQTEEAGEGLQSGGSDTSGGEDGADHLGGSGETGDDEAEFEV